MAVHFGAQWELDGKAPKKQKPARGKVAPIWKAKDNSVKDAWLNRHEEAQLLVERIVQLKVDRCERRETLELLCKDMCIRARAPWAQPAR